MSKPLHTFHAPSQEEEELIGELLAGRDCESSDKAATISYSAEPNHVGAEDTNTTNLPTNLPSPANLPANLPTPSPARAARTAPAPILGVDKAVSILATLNKPVGESKWKKRKSRPLKSLAR